MSLLLYTLPHCETSLCARILPLLSTTSEYATAGFENTAVCISSVNARSLRAVRSVSACTENVLPYAIPFAARWLIA